MNDDLFLMSLFVIVMLAIGYALVLGAIRLV
jgi:hypothetical protein